MSAVQIYPLKTPLPKIAQHEQLPVDTRNVGICADEIGDKYIFVSRGFHLSILKACTRKTKKWGEVYFCSQYDFPIKVLIWFPEALDEFLKPPIAGGLPAGKIISSDQNVDSEMLAVGKTSDGYDLTNWSRQSPLSEDGIYSPTRLSFSSHFLFDLGLLALWKKLGEQYERGTL